MNVQESNNVQQGEPDGESYTNYKGHQLLTMQGIMLWGFIAFLIYMAFKATAWPVYIPIALFASFLFYIISRQMNYFKLSNSFLVVKNHNFLWKEDVYLLANIKEVVFESRIKRPICLRVITNNFIEELYPADTLYMKTWLAFKTDLESKNIKVRNECL